jgi:hypothetical protein
MIYITIECRMYNCLDGIKAWSPELHHGFTTQGQPWRLGHGVGHLLGNSRTCGGRQLPPSASPSFRWLSNEWMDRFPLVGRPRGCIYALVEPWGVLHLALHEIFLGRDGNLISIKSASSRLSWFIVFPFRHHISHAWSPIMQIWCPSCMARNFLQLWYLLVSLEMKIRSRNRPWKTICSDFGLTA